jgi:hypothetical protein
VFPYFGRTRSLEDQNRRPGVQEKNKSSDLFSSCEENNAADHAVIVPTADRTHRIKRVTVHSSLSPVFPYFGRTPLAGRSKHEARSSGEK